MYKESLFLKVNVLKWPVFPHILRVFGAFTRIFREKVRVFLLIEQRSVS